MTPPSDIPSDGHPASPTRQRFHQRLDALSIKPTTHEYYLRWAEDWVKARGNRSADATTDLECLKRTPRDAVPAGITAYLDYLALERNVAPATQKHALNAMAFLTKKVFGIEEFTLEHVTPAHGGRRPPVVMTREEDFNL